jgi:hypothetical protein
VRPVRYSNVLAFMVGKHHVCLLIWHRACLYSPRLPDAVPKKRGPKTDVLEALLKRVDGLEARLKEKKTDPDMPTSGSAADDSGDGLPVASTSETQIEGTSDISLLDAPPHPGLADEAVLFSPTKAE